MTTTPPKKRAVSMRVPKPLTSIGRLREDLDGLSKQIADTPSQQDFLDLRAALFDEHGMPLFATKADVMPVVDFYKKLMLAAQLTDNGGKWVSRFIIGLVATFIALGALFGWFKAILIAILKG